MRLDVKRGSVPARELLRRNRQFVGERLRGRAGSIVLRIGIGCEQSGEPIASNNQTALVGGRRLSELVAYYDENPIEVKGQVEIHQSPMPADAGSHSQEGVIRAAL